jgi:hypothetical protein
MHLTTKLWASRQQLGALEKRLGRTLRPGKRGRPPTQKDDPRQRELVDVNGKVPPQYLKR